MDSIKAEKHTAMLLHKITAFLRYIEVLILTSLALWSSAYIKHSGDLLRRSVLFLLGPRFLFLLANAIVLSLLLLKPRPSEDDDVTSPPTIVLPREAAEEVVVYEEKKGASEHVRRTCKRSKSEKMVAGKKRRERSPELQRSVTDVGKAKNEEEEDEEEFRKTIEAFIEKHWKLQKEESMAIVCS